jgi:serine/threonine-protein kinase
VGTSYIGRTLGRYRIKSVIGSGGFATVYRAVDTGLERSVALKVVDPSAHHNPTVARRFVREGQAVASLDHPAVVPVYDTGEEDGILWLAMRLVEGGSLDDALRADRRLTSEQVVAIVARIGGALDHAHGHGLVHRDVKPSNILLEDNDPRRAWLVDFGIAVTARTVGQYTTGALGTAAYMAPEQSRPGAAGPLADIYSLGCVAFEMITGNRPYPGDDYVALLMAHVNSPVPIIGHKPLDALMARVLAKDPAARPASGAALAQDLRRALEAGAGTTALIPLDAATTGLVDAATAAPTVAEPRHDTLLHPAVHRPPPPVPAAPGPPAVATGLVGHRPPPPLQPQGFAPQSPAGGVPPHGSGSGTHRAASGGGGGGRARIAVGLAALLVATVTTVIALQLATRGKTDEVRDEQGLTYDVPRNWELRSEQPDTKWVDADDQLVATVENIVAEADASAIAQLGDHCDTIPTDRPVGDSALCTDPEEGTKAVGMVGNGQFWLVTAYGAASDEQTAFLDSVTVVTPTQN